MILEIGVAGKITGFYRLHKKVVKGEQMAEQNEMLKIVTPMMEHVCDHLCRFPGEISDQEELDKICGGCQMGDHICNILNTYNRTSRSEKSQGAQTLQGQAAHEKIVADWKWRLTERFSRVV